MHLGALSINAALMQLLIESSTKNYGSMRLRTGDSTLNFMTFPLNSSCVIAIFFPFGCFDDFFDGI